MRTQFIVLLLVTLVIFALRSSEPMETCFNSDFTTARGIPDSDSDGIADAVDNCMFRPNADQRNTDNDPHGNVCDPDFNNDGVINAIDLNILRHVFFTCDPHADLDGDGVVSISDLNIFKAYYFDTPGPAGQCLLEPSTCTGPVDFEFDDTGALTPGSLFVFRTDDPATIHHARRLIDGRTACNPQIQAMTYYGVAPYNPDWHFYMDGPIYFFGTSSGAIDACDHTANYIENHLAVWCDIQTREGCQYWCPWHSRLTREISLTGR